MQGLPRLLIVTEGERHLVAIDLTSGEPRWRQPGAVRLREREAPGAPGVPRMKRAGKLLYFTSGDSALTALDVSPAPPYGASAIASLPHASDARSRRPLRSRRGDPARAAQLHAIDPFSGSARWSRTLRPLPNGGGAPCTVEGAALVAGGVVAFPVRDREGLAVVAHDRDTGERRWETVRALLPQGPSWIAVDDLFIGNTPTGEVVAMEAATGELRYRHLLGRTLEHDVPRRLEPVLRSGALFVPHTDVRVLRRVTAPSGQSRPAMPSRDLLRVDERCDVYVAEEAATSWPLALVPGSRSFGK